MPPKPPRLIALELNELCPALLARWMGEGLLPNFAALHAQSDVFITKADVSDAGLLEPWIQWYSVHTGLPYDQHRVFHLTDGPKAGFDDIYQMLLRAGIRVASFASLNVAPFAAPGSVYVGDPWSEAGNASPPELNIYNRFVSSNVREYSNARAGLDASAYAQFVSFMAANGLSGGTIASVLAQLGSEKLRGSKLAWRRVALLDRLQFDVFRAYYRREQPGFASFFANSTAHLQHSYWRHMDPDAFTVKPDAVEMALYGEAIRFGYQAMDRLVGRFLALAKAENARLIFATALSQQPFLRHEESGGQHFYRLHDVRSVLARLGIAPEDVSPTMTHQYMARFASAAKASAARNRLESLHMADGTPVFGFAADDAGPESLYFGCQISGKTAMDAIISDPSGEPIRFGDLFYQIEAIKSGRHHPDGCLWIQTGSHTMHAEKCSILDILPTQLDLLGVAMPAGDFAGRSLVPLLGQPARLAA